MKDLFLAFPTGKVLRGRDLHSEQTRICLKNISPHRRIQNLLPHRLLWLWTRRSAFPNTNGRLNKMLTRFRKLIYIILPESPRQKERKKDSVPTTLLKSDMPSITWTVFKKTGRRWTGCWKK